MFKQQLISIKDAATSTGISEETIRQHIRSGKIVGEKKNYIFWDEWFVSFKDLAKIRDSVDVQAEFHPEPMTVSSHPMKIETEQLAGVGTESAADIGIKSSINYSWMPDPSFTSRHDVKGQHSHPIPQSLAAEIERAFSPNTAEEAFGARAYLEHEEAHAMNFDQQEHQNNQINGHQVSGQQATIADTASQRDGNQLGSKSVNSRSGGRRKRLVQPVEPTSLRDASRDSDSNDSSSIRASASVTEQNASEIQNFAPVPAPWTNYRTIAKTVAEEFLAPLLYRLEVQAAQLNEKDQLIAEQAAQLRLLPDYQRQSEEARKLADKKQQEALQLRQSLSWERKKALIKISAWQMKHVKVERQLKVVEQNVSDIQDQKETEVNYLHCQLTQLQEQLAHAQKPWWKKVFSSK